jgi:hypothetical protein
MAYWLKIGYFTESQEAAAGYWLKRDWVSDSPGRSSPWWDTFDRPRRGQTYPPHGPQYEVGDRLVIYITERAVCPAILEVVAEPRWDPGWVDARSDGRREGTEWAVVTDVRGLWSVKLADAPPIEDIGVAKARVQRHGHISLSEEEYEAAERLIAKPHTRKRRARKTRVARVPLESGEVEEYEITRPETDGRARRREARLVRDFGAFLGAQGDDVVRNKLMPQGSSHSLYSDLFNVTRNQLVEAKAGLGRGDIRMAIGQLADYGRFFPSVTQRAVLLDAKPQTDLMELLASQGIYAIWRNGEGFVDNAGGQFV